MTTLAATKDNPLAGVADPPSPKKEDPKAFDGDNEKQHMVSAVESMHNHRRLSARQIQFLAIAGTIGAALFVGIGSSLANGGPLSLLLGFSFWCTVIWAVAQCQIEMVTLLPLDGSFIRFAGRFVDESWGMAAGYNYAFFQAALACFDITIFTTVIGYWKTFNPGIFTAVLIVLYFCLNIWNVQWFGEIEFWLALGKVLLVFMLMFYTFITMLGGNPQGDRYGFRYWKDPGAMNEYINDGDLGRFQGFIATIIGAAFVIAGPEYVSMTAGEARNPRKVMPKAFNTIIYRLVVFFVIGALSVGIVCPYTSNQLLGNEGAFAAASPYIISMELLEIPVFPDIVNALIATSIVSAANGYVFTTSRSLLSLALAGQAPKFLIRLNRNGVPYICVCITIALTCLSFLSVSAGTAKVIGWWVNLVTASQLLNWIFMSTTWIRFNNAMQCQGLKREEFLPYRSWAQPYAAWYAFIVSTAILIISGYSLFYPDRWNTLDFIFQYAMVFICIVIVAFWKIFKKTRFLRGEEVDLHSDLQDIDTYTEEFNAADEARSKGRWAKLGDKIF